MYRPIARTTLAAFVPRRGSWRTAGGCLRVVVATAAAAIALAAAAAPTLLVVNSSDTRMYHEAIAGMQALPGATVTVTTLAGDDTAATAALAAGTRDTAIVALGNRASALVAQRPGNIPAVHCLVSGDADVVAGRLRVPLLAAAATQAQWLRRLLPAARNVAILYSPSQNARKSETLNQELRALGFHVITEPVPDNAQLPLALRRIGKADVLLALPDTVVYSPELARGLLLFTYRTRTPLVAYSQAWVRAGALYAIDWPYQQLGEYCGALALATLAPVSNAMLPPAYPAPRVMVNLRVATQLGLDWTAEQLAGVEVLRE